MVKARLRRDRRDELTKNSVLRHCFICIKTKYTTRKCGWKLQVANLEGEGRGFSGIREPEALEEAEQLNQVFVDTVAELVNQYAEHIVGMCLVGPVPMTVQRNAVQRVYINCDCGRLRRHDSATSMPMADGSVGQEKVVAPRDTGCSTVDVRIDLVSAEALSGATKTCVMIDGTIRTLPVAAIEVNIVEERACACCFSQFKLMQKFHFHYQFEDNGL